MSMESATLLAAKNNAAWCDLVCRSHGIPGAFNEHYWLNRGSVPRFYPNMVTLSESRPSVAAQMARAEEAMAAAPLRSLSVKDSFSTLGLDSLGFGRLFDASWIWRPPATRVEWDPAAAITWSHVNDGAGLARWEDAWADASAPAGPGRTFRDTLLGQPAVAFVAALREGRIVGGFAANVADGVVGLSNLFGLPGEPEALWQGAVTAVSTIFPGRPLVGYEHGATLDHAKAAGFKTLRPLTVWMIRG
jgi:hypothetical protein